MKNRRAVWLAVLIVISFPLVALAQAAEPDPGVVLGAIVNAIQGRQWTVVVGLSLTVVTFLARRWGGNAVPWFRTDRGGAVLAITIALLGTVGAVLAGGTFSVTTLLDALALATTNAGTYALIRKLLAPSDQAKLVSVPVQTTGVSAGPPTPRTP